MIMHTTYQMLCTSQCETPGSPHGHNQGILTIEFFLTKFPPSFAPLCQNPFYSPTPLYFKYNIPSHGSEHHCPDRLGGILEICQNPLHCLHGPLGIHTDWCIITSCDLLSKHGIINVLLVCASLV